MAITQRPNNPQLPPEALAARQAERQVEQAEARFNTETPAWGGVHPVSHEWEVPDRSIGRGSGVGFWETSPELWGIVHRDPAPGMADWTTVIPKFPERKPSSGLDPYTFAAARMTASAVRRIGAVRVATAAARRAGGPATPRLPNGRKAGPGRYSAANGAARFYKAPATRPALDL
jgi:hypothetical protein